MSTITPNIIINAAEDIVNLPQSRNDTFNRRWNSAFGASPEVCSVLWNKIDPFKTMSMGVTPKHLLWGLPSGTHILKKAEVVNTDSGSHLSLNWNWPQIM
jgi:hypothetical protein